VVFGLGARGLSEKIGIGEKFASKLIHTLVKTFPVAFDWVSSQSPDGDNMAKDRFGRRRRFRERDFYKIRNFSVQSPASMICLRKLVRLHEALGGLGRICFHVHDGYYMVCAVDKVDSVCEAGMAILEEEDPLFPGLRLRASCYSGARLDQMEPTKLGAAL
jgi:DNA polymerase I-like protein with 3'-5' exonuclease and polymerase domains